MLEYLALSKAQSSRTGPAGPIGITIKPDGSCYLVNYRHPLAIPQPVNISPNYFCAAVFHVSTLQQELYLVKFGSKLYHLPNTIGEPIINLEYTYQSDLALTHRGKLYYNKMLTGWFMLTEVPPVASIRVDDDIYFYTTLDGVEHILDPHN